MTSTGAKIIAVYTAFVFLLGAATIAVIAHAKAELSPGVADSVLYVCEARDVTNDTGDVVAILQSAGWTADPTDHREALYSPACNR
jgi:hypothetical protein